MPWQNRRIFKYSPFLTAMLSNLLIPGVFLLSGHLLLGQQHASDDYHVYASLIRSEISPKANAVTIIDQFTNDTTSIPWMTNSVESKDPQHWAELRLLTRDEKGNAVASIDPATQDLILDFYQHPSGDSDLKDPIALSGIKVSIIDSFPFKEGSRKDWQDFPEKYPGGIFQFSKIYYSSDGQSAVFYHSLYRNGLNAHGGLTVMTHINGKWKVKYHINFWQA
jgi:hypothetical protein